MTTKLTANTIYDRVFTLYGGYNGGQSPLTDTWGWNGVTWDQRFPESNPGVTTSQFCMAYDSVRNLTVALDVVNQLTWEYDGINWYTVATADSPPSSSNFGTLRFEMAYDSNLQKCVIYGGSYFGQSQTWEYDGINWTPGGGATGVYYGHSMTFDPILGCILQYGGGDNGGSATSGTYKYESGTWVQLSPTNNPGNISTNGNKMCYDTELGKVVLYDGGTQVWHWDGINWTQANISGTPPNVESRVMYDPTHGGLIVMPGSYSTFDTWLLTGSAWVQLNPSSSPGPRVGQLLG